MQAAIGMDVGKLTPACDHLRMRQRHIFIQPQRARSRDRDDRGTVLNHRQRERPPEQFIVNRRYGPDADLSVRHAVTGCRPGAFAFGESVKLI
jgi:hypothetical protein